MKKKKNKNEEEEEEDHPRLCLSSPLLLQGSGLVYRRIHCDGSNPNFGGHLVRTHVRQGIFDEHLWFSTLVRPEPSRFTRVQRVICLATACFIMMVREGEGRI